MEMFCYFYIHIRDTASLNRAGMQVIPWPHKGVEGTSSALADAAWQFPVDGTKSIDRRGSSGFGSVEVPNRQRPHFIHATFVDLEGGCHPAATGTLLTPPAEGAQL